MPEMHCGQGPQLRTATLLHWMSDLQTVGPHQAVATGDHLACSRPVPRTACASSSTACRAQRLACQPQALQLCIARLGCHLASTFTKAAHDKQRRGLRSPRLPRAQLEEQDLVVHRRGGLQQQRLLRAYKSTLRLLRQLAARRQPAQVPRQHCTSRAWLNQRPLARHGSADKEITPFTHGA